MSEMCTMSKNYNVDSNTKYSNYIEHQIKCSNENKIWLRPLNYNILRIKTANYMYFKLDNSWIDFELVLLRINSVRINRYF